MVKDQSTLLKEKTVKIVDLDLECIPIGSVLATDIFAIDNLPPFPASIMDGYAVSDLDFSNKYRIIDAKMLAGVHPDLNMEKVEKVAVYVTTGGPIPHGFVAVVPIEEVQICDDGKSLDLKLVDL
jgi:molybdopterin biosynthesis enzyme